MGFWAHATARSCCSALPAPFAAPEIVGLDVADLDFGAEGPVVTLRRSKTDQEGVGEKVGIPYGSTPTTCPARNLRGWLDAAGIQEGPVFGPVDRWGHVGPARLSDPGGQVDGAAARPSGGPAGGPVRRARLATAAAEAGARHHGADAAQERPDGPAVHPGRKPVPGERAARVGL